MAVLRYNGLLDSRCGAALAVHVFQGRGRLIERVTINGMQTRHALLGEQGPVVLMVHGWGAALELVIPLGERLAARGYRIFAPDLPGFGESEPPPAPWTVYDYAQFVLAYMDVCGLSQAHYFGHSFGGRLGLILGARHPERILKMVLADSAGVRPPLPLSLRLRASIYRALRDGLRRAGFSSLAGNLQTWYSQRYGSADYQNTSGVMRETFVRVVNEDLLPLASLVKPSTLLLWGERDEDTPLWQGQILEKTIPDAGLVVFSGAGHYSYLDNLADAVEVMDYFYKYKQD